MGVSKEQQMQRQRQRLILAAPLHAPVCDVSRRRAGGTPSACMAHGEAGIRLATATATVAWEDHLTGTCRPLVQALNASGPVEADPRTLVHESDGRRGGRLGQRGRGCLFVAVLCPAPSVLRNPAGGPCAVPICGAPGTGRPKLEHPCTA
jgi:hypothetical protein